MTFRPQPSELHPTAELRDWSYIDGRRYVHGLFYNHTMYEDGSPGTVMNIKEVRQYKDHIMIITHGGEFFRANYVERHLNGGSK
jgi:hypothetical protein